MYILAKHALYTYMMKKYRSFLADAVKECAHAFLAYICKTAEAIHRYIGAGMKIE